MSSSPGPEPEKQQNTSSSLRKEARFSWTGIQGKTLWDWSYHIIIPILLALGTLWVLIYIANQQDYAMQQQRDAMQQQNRIISEQLKSDILSRYTNTIGELILHEGLLQSKPEEQVQIMAKTQTNIALNQLDGEQRANLLYFIYRSQLINTRNPIILLDEANLAGANLANADLREANLAGANLAGADLTRTNLAGANLQHANLTEGKLERTFLVGANLGWTNLRNANLIRARLEGADLTETTLTEAIMPDGSKHP